MKPMSVVTTMSPPSSGSFITDTNSAAANMRGETILSLPIVHDKVWNLTQVISPSEAKQILLAIEGQRPIYPSEVRKYRNLIANGGFKVTHQGIAFDRNGKLIDGQHRLTACVEADAAIEVQVTFNMDRLLFDAMDRGRNRSFTDDLLCVGLSTERKMAEIMAAAAKLIWSIKHKRVPWNPPAPAEFQFSVVAEVIKEHPHLKHAAAFVYKHQRAWMGIGMATAAGFYTLFREANEGKADAFMEEVALGEHIGSGDPAYAFREYKRILGGAHGRAKRSAAMITLVKAWNAYVRHRGLSKVSSRLGNGVLFPEILRGK